MHSLVDARMLDTLSKKELEKYLGVTRKFHQASIVHGIHLLRLMKYDRQALAMRRLQSESENIDPIVWTNQRFIRWVRSIDLGEFADNLRSKNWDWFKFKNIFLIKNVHVFRQWRSWRIGCVGVIIFR